MIYILFWSVWNEVCPKLNTVLANKYFKNVNLQSIEKYFKLP